MTDDMIEIETVGALLKFTATVWAGIAAPMAALQRLLHKIVYQIFLIIIIIQ